ncbi:MAG: DNA-directed RNA polymerase subunit H [Nanoarchaeota archaeon]
MLINVLNHDMVPEHTVMSKQEQEELLERLNVTREKLPKILDSDTALIELKFKTDDIIKIKRKSVVAGESIYYRVVVNR